MKRATFLVVAFRRGEIEALADHDVMREKIPRHGLLRRGAAVIRRAPRPQSPVALSTRTTNGSTRFRRHEHHQRDGAATAQIQPAQPPPGDLGASTMFAARSASHDPGLSGNKHRTRAPQATPVCRSGESGGLPSRGWAAPERDTGDGMIGRNSGPSQRTLRQQDQCKIKDSSMPIRAQFDRGIRRVHVRGLRSPSRSARRRRWRTEAACPASKPTAGRRARA